MNARELLFLGSLMCFGTALILGRYEPLLTLYFIFAGAISGFISIYYQIMEAD